MVIGVPAATIRDIEAGEKTWHINAYVGTNMKKSLKADERIEFSCNQDRCVVCVKCVLIADSSEDALARAVDAGAQPGQLFKGAQTLQDAQAALRASASFKASPPAVAFRIEKIAQWQRISRARMGRVQIGALHRGSCVAQDRRRSCGVERPWNSRMRMPFIEMHRFHGAALLRPSIALSGCKRRPCSVGGRWRPQRRRRVAAMPASANAARAGFGRSRRQRHGRAAEAQGYGSCSQATR